MKIAGHSKSVFSQTYYQGEFSEEVQFVLEGKFALNNVVHKSRYTNVMSIKLWIFSYPSILAYILGPQKNCLNETVLSAHNICFG